MGSFPQRLRNVTVVAMLVGLPVSSLAADRVPGVNPQTPKTGVNSTIATLENGIYQQCDQPEPDKLDGAGVCLVFKKTGQQIMGYYGYPHSDRFVCLEGTVQDNRVVGKAHILSWPGEEWPNVPATPFRWDEEGHLTLQGGQPSPLPGQGNDQVTLITFNRAVLDVNGFYPYSQLKMSDPAKLCKIPQAFVSPAQLD